ncbi:SIS domain-containing protein [Virgibacillus dakarensis]|uniref:RpiR family transcriptional regulator n=1 Tax=Lentibacillus populi TaxID=1827502 RepID=A0A9W5TXJ8_9BACI|nr:MULTISPECIES: MurR/RpiR family transcriptional regulator [Bacillaceae]MBT2216326.1 MurR/RpiR family transcriptional regulator [Virgibacillus dakarensis]MTW85182.1 SIS domain-containing protein [Virgibacillus dakarensis]GGB43705.1 RpiR family transcriptional regulator [Lentibacillus populi]
MAQDYLNRTKQCFPKLTKGLKKVADHLISEPMIFAIHPAKKVGKIIGVSETMVIRFCTTIGYSGYKPLQKEIRKHLLDLNQSSLEELNTNNYPANNYTRSMVADINNLNSNINEIELENIDAFVETIIDSQKLVIAGYYHSFTFAHWLYFNLSYILGNASLYRPETDAGLLDLLPEKSCIIVFSFYRYALDTLRLAEEAKNKGIKVITITDSRVAPVTEFADIVIPINMKRKDLFSKGPVTLSIINAILYEIIQRVEDREKIQETYKYFIKDGED